RIQLRHHQAKGVEASVGSLQRVDVAPDLGFSHSAVGFENADHRPAILTRNDDVADVQSDELLVSGLADNHLICTEPKHASFDDRNLIPCLYAGRFYTAEGNVCGQIRG